jgi:vancomycin resistance protein YoaR
VTQPKNPKDAPSLNRDAITTYVRTSVVQTLSSAAKNPEFAVNGNRATFTPPHIGTEILVKETVDGIVQGLNAGAEKIKVVTKPVRPSGAVTSLMEQYGIKTLVARGESDFAGSPRNRIHNIRVGADRYHGLLIAPGAEFSFNDTLGPVDGEHGFKPELVIRHNVTTPEFGGGLCQVSTTMFRVALRAGVPITQRFNHSYAVSYYGTPGEDATIYPGGKNLKFVNDTPGHLLIQMKQEGTKLAFELWGSSDGRNAEILGPFPYERQKNGAVKARLVRKLTKGGETTRDEWFSNYKSPALFPKVLAENAERESWDARVRRIEEKDQKAREELERQQDALRKQQEATAKKSAKPTPRPTPPPTSEE